MIDRNMYRYDRYTGKYVGRRPYYRGPNLEKIKFPWHYVLFSQLAVYRWFIGGVWAPADAKNRCEWVRMENYRKDEFCEDHTEVEPCEYCARLNDDYGRNI